MRLVCLTACLLASTAALAADPDPAPPTAPAKPVKEKKICRSDVPTGSMMAVHTCHTREEWQQIDGANRRAAEEFNQERQTHTGSVH